MLEISFEMCDNRVVWIVVLVHEHIVTLLPESIGRAVYDLHEDAFVVASNWASLVDSTGAGKVDAATPFATAGFQGTTTAFWLLFFRCGMNVLPTSIIKTFVDMTNDEFWPAFCGYKLYTGI